MTVFAWTTQTNLRNNAEPVDPTDATTKDYVDSGLAALLPSGNI